MMRRSMLKPSKAKRRNDIETISSFPGLYIEKHKGIKNKYKKTVREFGFQTRIL